jgi:aminoglycoside 6'-N-acetyltransferase I
VARRVSPVRIAPAEPRHRTAWLEQRCRLWPDEDAAAMAREVVAMLAPDPHKVGFHAVAGDTLAGFAEAALRHDYVNGCETSPVAFLEGLYVDPAYRRQGVARGLVAAAAQWGITQGVTEFASDALLDNLASHAFHRAIGFIETDRVVYFRKAL